MWCLSHDCGLYGATELAHYCDPALCHWDSSKMRQHLPLCLEEGRMRCLVQGLTNLSLKRYSVHAGCPTMYPGLWYYAIVASSTFTWTAWKLIVTSSLPMRTGHVVHAWACLPNSLTSCRVYKCCSPCENNACNDRIVSYMYVINLYCVSAN